MLIIINYEIFFFLLVVASINIIIVIIGVAPFFLRFFTTISLFSNSISFSLFKTLGFIHLSLSKRLVRFWCHVALPRNQFQQFYTILLPLLLFFFLFNVKNWNSNARILLELNRVLVALFTLPFISVCFFFRFNSLSRTQAMAATCNLLHYSHSSIKISISASKADTLFCVSASFNRYGVCKYIFDLIVDFMRFKWCNNTKWSAIDGEHCETRTHECRSKKQEVSNMRCAVSLWIVQFRSLLSQSIYESFTILNGINHFFTPILWNVSGCSIMNEIIPFRVVYI